MTGVQRWRDGVAFGIMLTPQLMQETLDVTMPCVSIGSVFRLLERAKAERSHEVYDMDGNLSLRVTVLESEADSLIEDVKNASAGQATAVRR